MLADAGGVSANRHAARIAAMKRVVDILFLGNLSRVILLAFMVVSFSLIIFH
jgi:hypothetical protein